MSTEQTVMLDDKSVKAIDRLTKALNKADDRFNLRSNQVPEALSNTNSQAASTDLGLESGQGGSNQSLTSGFTNFQATMNEMIMPMVSAFSQATQMAFSSIAQRIGMMNMAFNQFTVNSNAGVQMLMNRLIATLRVVQVKQVATSKLGKIWNLLLKTVDGFNNAVKIGTFLLKAHKVVMASYEFITGKATFATKRFIVQNRILNAVLRSNPIVMISSLLVGAAAAFLSFGKGVSEANEHLKENGRLQKSLPKKEELSRPIEAYINNLDILDKKQLTAINDKILGEIRDEENKFLNDRVMARQSMKHFGFTSQTLPSPTDIALFANRLKSDDKVSPSFNLGPSGSWEDYYLKQVFGANVPKLSGARRSALSSQLGSFTKSELNSLFDLSRSFNEVPESLKKMKQFSQQMSGEFKRRNLDDPNKINEDMGLKEGTDSIAGGGKKMTNINISLENLVENIDIYSDNLEEGLEEIETMVKETFLRVLNSGNYAAQ